MIKPGLSRVRAKLGWWQFLPPIISRNTAQAIYPYIYVPPAVYDNLQSAHPNPHYVAVVIHENVHLERQARTGWLWWLIKYVLIPKFRFEEELAAIAPQIAYLRQQGIEFDIDARAKHLASYIYLWCVGYAEARRRLEELTVS